MNRSRRYGACTRDVSDHELINEMIFRLLNRIRRRPRIYLECETPTHLLSFIHGYTFERDLGNTNELNELVLFNDWIAKKFNYYDPPFGWAHMIEQQGEDKQDAFHLFYEL